jgi:hypothetical protein
MEPGVRRTTVPIKSMNTTDRMEKQQNPQRSDKNKFTQVVHHRVDPPSTLRQQDLEVIRGYSMGDSVRGKLHPESREMFHHDCRKRSIFAKMQQVLLVQRVDNPLRVIIDDEVGDDKTAAFIGGTDAINAEPNGKTGNRPEQRFEGFGKMVRDVVFINLQWDEGLALEVVGGTIGRTLNPLRYLTSFCHRAWKSSAVHSTKRLRESSLTLYGNARK